MNFDNSANDCNPAIPQGDPITSELTPCYSAAILFGASPSGTAGYGRLGKRC
jgi:hypothetical protein